MFADSFCDTKHSTAKSDMVIGGYRIPKGAPINSPPYVAHVAASNFEQPYRFWPERWLHTGSQNKADKGELLCQDAFCYCSHGIRTSVQRAKCVY